MSVVVLPNPAYWAPGHLVIPDQVDRPYVFKFRGRFKHLNEDEQRELDKKIALNQQRQQDQVQAILKGQQPPEFVAAITDKEIVELVMVDWEGFKDSEGRIAIYTPAARAQVCADTRGLETAMCRAYLESRNPDQVLKEAEKNSEAPPATT
jgi:hypothetical protein